MTAENISERTSKLIANARQPRPTSNYKCSWHKYIGWNIELKIDPHTCHVNFFLEFLAHLFRQKLAYSTVNSLRSKIPTYHDLTDNMLIVQHPKVCTLMGEMCNVNPPKYLSIWDVEQVLTGIKGLPDNTGLSDRNLPLKLIILLFLTSAERCHEIYYLHIRYMVKISSSYKFHFTKTTKSWKKFLKLLSNGT